MTAAFKVGPAQPRWSRHRRRGIVYADIDLADLIRPKLLHDITGNYNQFGALSLNLNRTAQRPLLVSEPAEPTADLRLEPTRLLEEQR